VRKPAVFSFKQAAGVPVAGVAGYRVATEARMHSSVRIRARDPLAVVNSFTCSQSCAARAPSDTYLFLLLLLNLALQVEYQDFAMPTFAISE